MMWAVENYHATIVELLLEKGADTESKDNNYGLTPLARAAWNGYEAVVRLLLKHGAMVDAKDNRQGLTPLSWAALKQHKGVVELLLQKDANTEVFDYYDCTPLAYAIENRSDAITKLLLVKGAKVNYTYYRIHDDLSILDLSSVTSNVHDQGVLRGVSAVASSRASEKCNGTNDHGLQ
jgi:ankyrin repeat protein